MGAVSKDAPRSMPPLAFLSPITCVCSMELTVYILLCADGSYYVGSTKQEIEARVWEHNEGVYDGYTKLRRPVTLVFTETYDRLTDGHARERQIKGWSRAQLFRSPLWGGAGVGVGPAHLWRGKSCIGGGALLCEP